MDNCLKLYEKIARSGGLRRRFAAGVADLYRYRIEVLFQNGDCSGDQGNRQFIRVFLGRRIPFNRDSGSERDLGLLLQRHCRVSPSIAKPIKGKEKTP